MLWIFLLVFICAPLWLCGLVCLNLGALCVGTAYAFRALLERTGNKLEARLR